MPKHRLDKRARGGESGEKWIQGAHIKKGALHKELGVPAGKKISEKKLEKAEHSKKPLLKRRAILAETLKKLHHH